MSQKRYVKFKRGELTYVYDRELDVVHVDTSGADVFSKADFTIHMLEKQGYLEIVGEYAEFPGSVITL